MRIGVIGAGPVGIYFTKLCLEKGLKVTLIDAGGFKKESANLNRSKYIFKTDSAMPEGVHKIGGGSNLWRGRLSEFLLDDFNKSFQNLDYSWPIKKENLEHHYAKLYKFLSSGNFNDDQSTLKYLSKFLDRLPKEFIIRSFRYCQENMFLDILNEIVNHPNLEIKEEHFCQEIAEVNSHNGLVASLLNKRSQSITNRFDKIVLTCGTIQTTALLLRSSKLVGNSYKPILGNFLSEHIEGYIGYTKIKHKNEKLFFKQIYLDNKNRSIYDFHGLGFALGLKKLDTRDILNVQYEFREQTQKSLKLEKKLHKYKQNKKIVKRLLNTILFIERFICYILTKFKNIKDTFTNVDRYGVYIKSEEIPQIDSKISISDTDKTTVIYDHKIGEDTLKLLHQNITKFTDIFTKCFKAKLILFNEVKNINLIRQNFGPNWHPMGTTRMGDDPKTSVCNSDLQLHNCEKLFILSASVFPSVSNTNPTLTVLALANRLANSNVFLNSANRAGDLLG